MFLFIPACQRKYLCFFICLENVQKQISYEQIYNFISHTYIICDLVINNYVTFYANRYLTQICSCYLINITHMCKYSSIEVIKK